MDRTAITSKAPGALVVVQFNRPVPTVLPTITWKALDRLANTPGHDTTQTATTSKALGRLADHAVRDILAHVRSLG